MSDKENSIPCTASKEEKGSSKISTKTHNSAKVPDPQDRRGNIAIKRAPFTWQPLTQESRRQESHLLWSRADTEDTSTIQPVSRATSRSSLAPDKSTSYFGAGRTGTVPSCEAAKPSGTGGSGSLWRLTRFFRPSGSSGHPASQETGKKENEVSSSQLPDKGQTADLVEKGIPNSVFPKFPEHPAQGSGTLDAHQKTETSSPYCWAGRSQNSLQKLDASGPANWSRKPLGDEPLTAPPLPTSRGEGTTDKNATATGESAISTGTSKEKTSVPLAALDGGILENSKNSWRIEPAELVRKGLPILYPRNESCTLFWRDTFDSTFDTSVTSLPQRHSRHNTQGKLQSTWYPNRTSGTRSYWGVQAESFYDHSTRFGVNEKTTSLWGKPAHFESTRSIWPRSAVLDEGDQFSMCKKTKFDVATSAHQVCEKAKRKQGETPNWRRSGEGSPLGPSWSILSPKLHKEENLKKLLSIGKHGSSSPPTARGAGHLTEKSTSTNIVPGPLGCQIVPDVTRRDRERGAATSAAEFKNVTSKKTVSLSGNSQLSARTESNVAPHNGETAPVEKAPAKQRGLADIAAKESKPPSIFEALVENTKPFIPASHALLSQNATAHTTLAYYPDTFFVPQNPYMQSGYPNYWMYDAYQNASQQILAGPRQEQSYFPSYPAPARHCFAPPLYHPLSHAENNEYSRNDSSTAQKNFRQLQQQIPGQYTKNAYRFEGRSSQLSQRYYPHHKPQPRNTQRLVHSKQPARRKDAVKNDQESYGKVGINPCFTRGPGSKQGKTVHPKTNNYRKNKQPQQPQQPRTVHGKIHGKAPTQFFHSVVQPSVVEYRERQLAMAKCLPAYIAYLGKKPKQERSPDDPVTPRATENVCCGMFQKRLVAWKREIAAAASTIGP